MISRSDIEGLVGKQNGLCLSIFLPTHRVGQQVLNGGDATMLKNRIRQARELLARHEATEAEANELLKPAEELLEDGNFWRHQTEGLAIFISKGFSRHFQLTFPVEENVYVLDHFYVTPVLPAISMQGKFYVLVLDRNKVEFLDANKERIRPINIAEFMPDTMNKALPFDVKGHDQDFHNSTATVNGTNIVHGSGSNKSDEQYERTREWLLEVDNGLQKILHNQQVPVVLAGVDHVCSIFRDVTKYKHLAEGNLHINGDNHNHGKLHEEGLKLVELLLREDETTQMERYQNVKGTGITAETVEEVAAMAVQGRVQTLFITMGQPVWGVYNPDLAQVEVHQEYHKGDADLINLAAIKTLTQSGNVFVHQNGTTAQDSASVKALLRY